MAIVGVGSNQFDATLDSIHFFLLDIQTELEKKIEHKKKYDEFWMKNLIWTLLTKSAVLVCAILSPFNFTRNADWPVAAAVLSMYIPNIMDNFTHKKRNEQLKSINGTLPFGLNFQHFYVF